MIKRTNSILAGLNDALAYMQGDTPRGKAHVVEVPDVDVAKRPIATRIAALGRTAVRRSAANRARQGKRAKALGWPRTRASGGDTGGTTGVVGTFQEVASAAPNRAPAKGGHSAK